MDYMRCLFWNSALHTPFGTLHSVNKRKPQGIWIQNDGDRLLYGDSTHLRACYVKDLNILQDTSGNMVMEWTVPPAKQFDSKTHGVVPVTKPFKRSYVWKPKT
jgi:hypothetical protein